MLLVLSLVLVLAFCSAQSVPHYTWTQVGAPDGYVSSVALDPIGLSPKVSLHLLILISPLSTSCRSDNLGKRGRWVRSVSELQRQRVHAAPERAHRPLHLLHAAGAVEWPPHHLRPESLRSRFPQITGCRGHMASPSRSCEARVCFCSAVRWCRDLVCFELLEGGCSVACL